MAAELDLAKLKYELQSNQTRRWQALGMLQKIFSCVNLPWLFKKHAINFLVEIIEGSLPENSHDEDIEVSDFMPSLYAALRVSSFRVLNLCIQFLPTYFLTAAVNIPVHSDGHYICIR